MDGQVGAIYKKAKGFLRIDPLRKPKTMDLSDSEAFKPGKTFYVIYELNGDALKTCNVQKDIQKREKRPTEFKTNPNSDVVIAHWKRKSRTKGDIQDIRPNSASGTRGRAWCNWECAVR